MDQFQNGCNVYSISRPKEIFFESEFNVFAEFLCRLFQAYFEELALYKMKFPCSLNIFWNCLELTVNLKMTHVKVLIFPPKNLEILQAPVIRMRQLLLKKFKFPHQGLKNSHAPF